jgi:hypothetical protein
MNPTMQDGEFALAAFLVGIPSTVSTIFPIGPSVEMAGSRMRKNAPFGVCWVL